MSEGLVEPSPTWFDRDPLVVAVGLLGAVIRVDDDVEPVAVRLTEVEAYRGAEDPGSHAYRGRTRRNDAMFAAGGVLYVYFTYGMHYCVNVVCGPAGKAAAVLLRAGEVVSGTEVARARRPTARREVDLARGPASLARALGLTGADDGARIGASRVSLLVPTRSPGEVRTGPRVGVAGPGGSHADYPWRFWLAGEPTVSAYRAAQPRPGGRSQARARAARAAD